MIPRRPEDGPFHMRHKCQPNTDVSAFVRENHFIHCEPYSCFMRAEVCKQRRAFAHHAPRRAFKASIGQSWKTDVLMQVDKCLKCSTYYRPAPKPVPAKHGTCSCGCGKEGRLVGRGMLSGCYQRYRKGKC